IGCDSQKTIETYDLRCENLREPLGIDTTIPRFSWKIKISENENKQVAYQILVAGNQDELSENDALLWNSGKVESDNTILVSYNGQKLNSGNFVWWKVRVWDKAGNVSEWSTPACFSIGL